MDGLARANESAAPKRDALRPHMERRPGETTTEWHSRLHRSCFKCGEEIHNKQERNEHENECRKG